MDNRSGMTTLLISDEEMEDIMEIFRHLEKLGLLNKGFSKTIENEAKKQEKRISWHATRYIRCEFIGKYSRR